MLKKTLKKLAAIGQSKSDSIYLILWLLFFGALFIFRLHNILAFSPYWGYDGGAHIDYILSIAEKNSLPNPAANYLAWHEPFYYLVFGGLLKIFLFFKHNPGLKTILHFLGFFQVILSLAVSFFIMKLVQLFTKDRLIVLSTVAILSFMPSLNQASTFITNELANYFLIIFSLYYFSKNYLAAKQAGLKQDIWLGIILGLALLTKVTSIIIVGVVALFFVYWLIKNKKLIFLKRLGLIFLLIFVINIPWFVYRHNNVTSSISIISNNAVKPIPLQLDSRVNFFWGFDKDVFLWPYFSSGDLCFWSMLYADSFFDYYGTIENKDFLAYKIGNNIHSLVRISAKTYVTAAHFQLAGYLSKAGLILSLLFIIGLFYNFKKLFAARRCELDFLAAVLPLFFLAALIYYAYRYPYYDQGIIKAIFIFPGYIFLVLGGLKALSAVSRKLLYFSFPFLAVYFLLVLRLYWIIKFNY
jgi:4-amino-4-deoxy-L-arabinose transferase-like glycosyltransferase